MGKTGTIIVGTGATVGLAILCNYLAKTGSTASKLDIVLDEVSLGAGSGVGHLGIKLPSATFKAKLRIKNPTSNDLTISQPYVRIYEKDPNSPFAESHPNATKTVLKAKQETSLTVDVEINAAKALLAPGLVAYLLKRVKGAPSTRQVNMTVQIQGNGINQTLPKTIHI